MECQGCTSKQRYINPKIEQELVDFKKEIEQKFQKSALRRFTMPLNNQPSSKAVESSGIFAQGRSQKGRAVAQSNDFAFMNQYLKNPESTKNSIPTGRGHSRKPEVLNTLHLNTEA